MERAKAFYSAVFRSRLRTCPQDGMAIGASYGTTRGGCRWGAMRCRVLNLAKGGTTVYFACDSCNWRKRVAAAGGKRCVAQRLAIG